MKPATKAIAAAYQRLSARGVDGLTSRVRHWEQQPLGRRKKQLLLIALLVTGAAGASLYYSFKGSFLPDLTPKRYDYARSK